MNEDILNAMIEAVLDGNDPVDVLTALMDGELDEIEGVSARQAAGSNRATAARGRSSASASMAGDHMRHGPSKDQVRQRMLQRKASLAKHVAAGPARKPGIPPIQQRRA